MNRDTDRRSFRDLGPRVNQRIRVPEVRVIDPNGNQLGVMPTREAFRLAQEQGFDLVEVAPNAQPPVCRILDYGKFKYEEAKKQRETRGKAREVRRSQDVKGIRLRAGTDVHDFQHKLADALRFLQMGHKVQVTLIFRGREASHPEVARKQLDRLAESTRELAVVEREPFIEGRRMTMMLAPK
ncbi:MAG: translation initiation factor IF-3 [Armatimonadetes bacterium]|nr:translation initiation factor IF-3 [Armatimonadota bacterium]